MPVLCRRLVKVIVLYMVDFGIQKVDSISIANYLYRYRERPIRMNDYKEPKTRVEKKGRGQKKTGPYSAKHVRLAEAARQAKPKK